LRWDSLKTFPVVEGRRRETGIAKTHELLFYRFSAAALESPSEAGFVCVCVCVPLCPLLRLFSFSLLSHFGHKLIFIVDVGSLFWFRRERNFSAHRPILDVNNDEPSSHMREITILGYSELSPVFFVLFFIFFIYLSHGRNCYFQPLLLLILVPRASNHQPSNPPEKRFPFGIECTAAPPPDSSCSISLPRLLRR
jgi:hypothetical protein